MWWNQTLSTLAHPKGRHCCHLPHLLIQPWTAAVGFSSPPRPQSPLSPVSPNRHFPVLNCMGVNGRGKQTCVPQSQDFLPFGWTYMTGDFKKGTGQVQSCCSLFFSWEQLLPEAGIVPCSSSTPEWGGPRGSVLLCLGPVRSQSFSTGDSS